MLFQKFFFHFAVKKEIKEVINKVGIPALTKYIHIGKALRSSLMYQISAKNKISSSIYKKLVHCSALLELIHNISIIHDDVIDGEKTRRNQKTLNQTMGLYKSVSMGDFFFLLSFKNFFEKDIEKTIQNEIIAKLKLLCLGEIQQDEEFSKINQVPSVKKLIEVVRHKTGSLFALSCLIPYSISVNSKESINFAEQCGFFYGIVYQVLDDILDIHKDLTFLDGDSFFRHWTLPILILRQNYYDYFLTVINQNQKLPKLIYQKIADKCFIELNKIFNQIKKKSVNQENRSLFDLIINNLNTILINKKMSQYCFKI